MKSKRLKTGCNVGPLIHRDVIFVPARCFNVSLGKKKTGTNALNAVCELAARPSCLAAPPLIPDVGNGEKKYSA